MRVIQEVLRDNILYYKIFSDVENGYILNIPDDIVVKIAYTPNYDEIDDYIEIIE